MTLPASPNAISFNDINVEMGATATRQTLIDEYNLRMLAEAYSGAISLSNFHSKTWTDSTLGQWYYSRLEVPLYYVRLWRSTPHTFAAYTFILNGVDESGQALYYDGLERPYVLDVAKKPTVRFTMGFKLMFSEEYITPEGDPSGEYYDYYPICASEVDTQAPAELIT